MPSDLKKMGSQQAPKMFLPITPFRLWFSAQAGKIILAEAERKRPKESGGILLGYWTENRLDAVITAAIGPGSKAIHGTGHFAHDTQYEESEIAKSYFNSGRVETYLGDWHSHPGTANKFPSRQDRRTLRQIASYKPSRAPTPIMVIVAEKPKWNFAAWRGLQRKVGWVVIGMRVDPAEINFF